MEREEERGGEERGREAVAGAGATGSHRASRSGLLRRGTGVMLVPDANHEPWESEGRWRGRERKGGVGNMKARLSRHFTRWREGELPELSEREG